MKIVCSGNMPFAKEAFSTLGEAVVLKERSISPADVRDADILAIRSTTKVNRNLIEGSRVRFIGTATIGFDHIDTSYLATRNITWCAAAGCNANSVAEYVVSALLHLARHQGLTLAHQTIGIIGVGNVGRRVAEKAAALGMRILLNDPPRERTEGNKSDFVSLSKLLKKSNIVTMHVPLTSYGADSTIHLANREFFSCMKPGSIFINSARGPVVQNEALFEAMDNGTVSHAVIDTWDPEPDYPSDLLNRVDLGTPHIAGYSFEGKVMGTAMVYQAVCRFLGMEPLWNPDASMPPPAIPRLCVDAANRSDEVVLWDIISSIYNIGDDDRNLRSLNSSDCAQRARHFDDLRRNYPVRREFRYTRVVLKHASESLARSVAELGFKPA